MRRAVAANAVLLAAVCAASLAAVAVAPSAAGAPDDHRRVASLREVAVPLRTIDPGDDDLSDLEPLRAALADARVVVLGEATHGEGATFLVKSRLVRFLHREMGFDVLAFESGFYDCREAWRRIEAGAEADATLRDAVFPIWTRSEQVQPLLRHFAGAARSERPLVLAGIDPQFTGAISQRHLGADLRRVAEGAGLDGERFSVAIAAGLSNLVDGRYESGELPSPEERARFDEALAALEARLEAPDASEIPERAFWLRLVTSTRDHAASSWTTDFSRRLLEDPESYQVRERLMGEQLAWLAREGYPGRRIIVWMHSGHAARGLAGIEVPSEIHRNAYRTLKPAGHVARDLLGDALYTLGFLAYQGEYATVFQRRPVEIWKSTAGSLEDLFHRTGLPHAFLDLSRPDRLPRWLRKRTIARPIGYLEMRARWPEVYDGFIYLDRMESSRPIADAAARREPSG